MDDVTLGQLQSARQLAMPDREAMLRRDESVQSFWNEHRTLLSDAWEEWENERGESSFAPSTALLDPNLRHAVERAWNDPTTESAVRDLMEESATDVFSFQFFDPDRIAELREYLEGIWNAGIPLRPPYGIVLNRGGAMLDERSVGYLAAPSFQTFYRDILDQYMRPISRLLFPEVVGYDTQTFGFSINYRPNTDTSIRPHSDASAVTLNINLNTPGEDFTGSTVDFLDQATGEVSSLSFEPGTAIIHRGRVPHAAQPITSGERTNFVLWLFGDGGRVPHGPLGAPTIAAHERWSVPHVASDGYAPF